MIKLYAVDFKLFSFLLVWFLVVDEYISLTHKRVGDANASPEHELVTSSFTSGWRARPNHQTVKE